MGTSLSLASLSSPSLQLRPIDSKQEAQRLINEAERLDFYLEECYDDRRNALARQHMTYAANTVSPSDHAALRTVSSIRLPKRLTADLQTVYLVPLMPTADGGMPHTRPLPNREAIICYADVRMITEQKTLIHELWHVHQRLYQTEWQLIFQKLGWTEWKGTLPVSLEKGRRYNPDTIDSPLWIYRQTWVPIPIFRDISKPNVGEVDVWFYDIKHEYHTKNVPSDLAAFWPDLPPSAYEHPRELAAYVLSDPAVYPRSPALQQLVTMLGNIALL